MKPSKIIVHAPGRMCIMGEHQDYLGLPVISGALSLGVDLTLEPAGTREIAVELTQTGTSRRLVPEGPSAPISRRDYLRSGLNLMMQRGMRFSNGYRVTVTGTLPIGKGVSSSSALCTGWITALNAIADHPAPLTPLEIARLAFETEVLYFGEPGGMQDHVASAVGGLLHMDFSRDPGDPVVTPLPAPPPGWILLDSGIVKDTVGMIQSIRSDVEGTVSRLSGMLGRSIDLATFSLKDLPAGEPVPRFRGTIINRNLTRYTRSLLKNSRPPDADSGRLSPTGSLPGALGRIIDTHHRILSRDIGSSSPVLDALCDQARRAGCIGAKVIGSGGGGCVLGYAPAGRQQVIARLREQGVDARPVNLAPGVTVRRIPVHGG